MKFTTKTAGILVILLGLLGAADAAVLTYDHQKASLGQGADTVCAPDGGCAAVRATPMATIRLGTFRAALPIALLGLACYLVVAGLGVVRLLKPDNDHVPRLLFAIGVLATLYSAFLFAYSLMEVGTVCPFCVGLYVIGLALLIVAKMSLPDSLGQWLRRVWKSTVSGPGVGALLGFVLVTLVGYNVYAAPINDRLSTAMGKLKAQAADLPNQSKVTLATEGRPSEGPADAPVHIVKFADYECPHCGSVFKSLHEVSKQRPGKIRITMMNFPLSSKCNPQMKDEFHKNACLMAYAGECAHRQGKWAQIAEWLYDNGRRADEEAVTKEAGRLGLDVTKFTACLTDPEVDKQVKVDILAGVDAGVRATPTFFVNGRKVEGGRPLEVMLIAVDGFLK